MLSILSPKCSAVRVVVITLIYRWLLLVNGDFNAESELLFLFKISLRLCSLYMPYAETQR